MMFRTWVLWQGFAGGYRDINKYLKYYYTYREDLNLSVCYWLEI